MSKGGLFIDVSPVRLTATILRQTNLTFLRKRLMKMTNFKMVMTYNQPTPEFRPKSSFTNAGVD